jgi:hypothetical protein
MTLPPDTLIRSGALLAINLLFLMVWGFTSLDKLVHGKPPWFADKFGGTMLAWFPGLTAAFWLLAVAELGAFALAALALSRGEFMGSVKLLPWMLVWSLFVFVALGFGQWLTAEYTGTFQLFTYFCGTLIALQYTVPAAGGRAAEAA